MEKITYLSDTTLLDAFHQDMLTHNSFRVTFIKISIFCHVRLHCVNVCETPTLHNTQKVQTTSNYSRTGTVYKRPARQIHHPQTVKSCLN